MRILAYKVANFKGLKEAQFDPDRNVVLIVGPNASGKTSALDAIESTLSGKDASPDQPVTRGAAQASCTLHLDGLKVVRKWFPDGESRLYVENTDGSKPRAPQTTLSGMLSSVAMDPLRFARAEPKEQARTLRKITGLEQKFQIIDIQIDELETERRDVNRAVRGDEASLVNYPTEIELASAPDQIPSDQELRQRFIDATNEQAENKALRDRLTQDEKSLHTARVMLLAVKDRIAKIQKAMDEAQGDLVTWEKEVREGQESVDQTREVVETLTDPDLTAIRAELDDLGKLKDRVRLKRERTEVQERLAANTRHALAITAQIEQLRQSKSDAMLKADLPVPGLQFDGDEVLLNAVPLAQASSSECIRIGLEVGLASNPKLRVVLVRDAILLDDATLEAVCRWAVDRDVQVWLEMVGTSSDPRAIILEEGRIMPSKTKARNSTPLFSDTPQGSDAHAH